MRRYRKYCIRVRRMRRHFSLRRMSLVILILRHMSRVISVKLLPLIPLRIIMRHISLLIPYRRRMARLSARYLVDPLTAVRRRPGKPERNNKRRSGNKFSSPPTYSLTNKSEDTLYLSRKTPKKCYTLCLPTRTPVLTQLKVYLHG